MAPKVYYDIMSQPCRALYIFLKCSGVPFEAKVIALRKGEHKTEEYLKIHPFGKVPALEDDGFTLTESVAILKYLSDKYAKNGSWYPRDLKKRAKVDEFFAWQHLELRMKCAKVFLNEVMMPGVLGDNDKLVAEMNQALDNLEKVFLQDKKFIAGDTITVADLLAICEIMQPTTSGRDVLARRPKLQQWMNRVKLATSPYFEEAHVMVYRLRERQMKKGKL